MNPKYLADINLLEAPLVGINPKLNNVELRSQMPDEELRAWVGEVRTVRENRATFKSRVELKNKSKTETKADPKQLEAFTSFTDDE